MSARVLLNLLNELGESDKMRGVPSILSLFGNVFYKGAIAIRCVFSIVDMITNTKFSNCTLVFKSGCGLAA